MNTQRIATFLFVVAALQIDGPFGFADTRPNVIVIYTDDQRYDELGVTGHPVLETPQIDQLANDGVLFRNYFAPSPSCLPSRVALVTGQWERCHTVGFRGDRALSARQWADSLPMTLKRAGYFTGIVGKSNIPGIRQRDIDYYCASDATRLGFYPKELDPEFAALFGGARSDTQLEILGEAVDDFLGSDAGFAERSAPSIKPYLGRRPKDAPFFLLLAVEVPHGTGVRTMEQRPTDDELYRTKYRDRAFAMPVPQQYVPRGPSFSPKLPLEIYSAEQNPSYHYCYTPEGLRERQIRTCQTIEGVDRLVGRVRARLESLGASQNTIFVFASDHGLMHGEWGYGGKCLLYEPSIHAPLIIYDPRKQPVKNGIVDALAVTPDLAPTILDLCGVAVPPAMQGRSLWSLVESPAGHGREDFFAECQMLGQDYPLVQAVRGLRWKYMRYWLTRPVPEDYREILNLGLNDETPAYEELFDLEADPLEQHNLAAREDFRNTLRQMQQRCVALERQTLGRDPVDALPSMPKSEWKRETRDYYRDLASAKPVRSR